MTESRDWYAYVLQSGIGNPLPFLHDYFSYSEPVIRLIMKRIPPTVSTRILEVGSGSGLSGMWLASLGYNVVQVDCDSRVVALALENAKRFNIPAYRHQIICADARQIVGLFLGRTFDLSYTQGLLEHFDEAEAIKILQCQSQVSREILTIVPGKNMRVPRVDERPFTLRSLVRLHRQAGLEVIKSFSYGDEPAWMRLLLPPLLLRLLERHIEIGSDIGVLAEVRE